MRVLTFRISIALLVVVAGCGGGGGSVGEGAQTPTPSGTTTTDAATTDLRIQVKDVAGAPITGAVVAITVGGTRREATTNTDGVANMLNIPTGDASVIASAVGFETVTFTATVGISSPNLQITLDAKDAWAIARPIALATRALERASDESAMTVSLDIAVIGSNFDPIETLTRTEFGIGLSDCGWHGPRECASDAAGNVTGEWNSGAYSVDGDARAFERRPPSARRPYVVGVLALPSASTQESALIAPALRSFFGALGGNDSASLMSLQRRGGSLTFQVHGPFTNNGTSYFEAIDELAALAAESAPQESAPQILEAVTKAIDRVAAADAFGLPMVERHVLILTMGAGLSVPQVLTAAELARRLGVRVSTIKQGWYGFSELAARTGGMVASIYDARQYRLVFGAMDRALAGTLPFYRMQYRFIGGKRTFVAGGNVKTRVVVTVPSTPPNGGALAEMDIAIP